MRTEYICELCDMNFGKDYDSCLKHEKEDHIKPKVYAEIKAGYQPDSTYPDYVHITMQDGAVLQYSFEDIVKDPDKEESLCANTDLQGKPFDF